MKSSASRLRLFLSGALILILACTFTRNLPTGGEPTERTSPTDTAEVTGETPSQVDLWIQATGALRSVTLELVTTYSDRDSKILSAQIDANGNIHLSSPIPVPETMAATPEAQPPGDFELFVVDGSAYTRIGSEDSVTQDDSFISMLEDTLLGPEGPGLWLNLVPESGFVVSGEESSGGFVVTTYSINYQIEQGSLAGKISVDKAANALIDADLTVSEGLFFPPGVVKKGDVHITLTVQQAQVPAIALP